MYYFIIFLMGISVVRSECPDVKAAEGIDKSQVTTGTWYDDTKGCAPWTDGWSCTTISFAKIGNQFNISGLSNGEPTSFLGTYEFTNNDNDGITTFIAEQFKSTGDKRVPLKIVATDYTNYLIYFGCAKNSESFVWLLLRSPSIDSNQRAEYMKKLESIPSINVDELIRTDQSKETCG